MEPVTDAVMYSARVTELFEAAPHSGAPDDANRRGHAVSKSRDAAVVLHLRVTDAAVRAAGFHAFGCPHVVAAAAAVCEDLQGRPLAELAAYDAGFLEDALPLPPAKRDIRILLEDAARAAVRGD